MKPLIGRHLADQIVQAVFEVCGHNVNFIDCDGYIYASTDSRRIGSYHEIGKKAAKTGQMIEVEADSGYEGTMEGVNLPVFYEQKLIAVIGISGSPQEVRKYAYLAENITLLLIREQKLQFSARTCQEKRHSYIRNLIYQEEPLSPEEKEELKEFALNDSEKMRVMTLVFCQECSSAEIAQTEPLIHRLFEKMSVFLFTYQYPRTYLAVLTDTQYQRYHTDLRAFAEKYSPYLKIAVGKAEFLDQLPDSFGTCRIIMKSPALLPGSFACYEDLTLEPLLCSSSVGERKAFWEKMIGKLTDQETELLNCYFDTEMSLLETSRQQHLHKNTLQYRLDKIYRKTGYNPRIFKDAVLFYLALRSGEIK